MFYTSIAVVLGIIIGIFYLYQVFTTLENSIAESRSTPTQSTSPTSEEWKVNNTFDYKVLISIVGSTLLIYLLSVAPVFWWLIPFAGLAAATGVIIAFIIDKKSAR
jgi:uncharacterized ion transporter superfamily protein YfcC